MINRISIRSFKSIRQTDLRLGPVNYLVGSNASGKSNFLDALRFLQGIGLEYTFEEIMNGKPAGSANGPWEGIRGGSDWIPFGEEERFTTLEVEVVRGAQLPQQGDPFRYSLEFCPTEFRCRKERLECGAKLLVFSFAGAGTDEGGRRLPSAEGLRDQSIAGLDENPLYSLRKAGIARSADSPVTQFLDELREMQQLELRPYILRAYSQPHRIERMGEHGENFAGLVRTICASPDAKEAYLSWLRELRPDEVEDVGTKEGAMHDPMFMLKERGREFLAPVLSDGTLRFSALAAALFQPNMPHIITIEEVETGVHPQRLRLVVELLRRRAEQSGVQLFVTTHSPVVLSWLTPEERNFVFLFKREEETGESTIRPLSEVALLPEALNHSALGDLFMEGWLESVP